MPEIFYGMNIWRILADSSHFLSKCILIYAIHRNRSAEGVSLITQMLYMLVFLTRYLNFWWTNPNLNWYNFIFKMFYLTTSAYIIGIMLKGYARTREREKAWKMGMYCLLGSIVLSPFVAWIFPDDKHAGFLGMFRVFSYVLESVCVLPQLLLLRQTTVPTVIDSYYLVALGSYRALYICNWIERGLEHQPWQPDIVSVIFGVIQTLFYIDFAWVYYTRQRVKLRHGGIVDSDDYSSSWILRRLFNKHVVDEHIDDDEESAPALGRERGEDAAATRGKQRGWGARGISVSADDGVLEHESLASPVQPGAKMRDPDELARVLDEEEDSDDDAPPKARPAGVSGGEEWRDGPSR